MSKEADVVILTNAEWLVIRDAAADISCWHMGFKAANPGYHPPPQLKEFEDVIRELKYRVRKS